MTKPPKTKKPPKPLSKAKLRIRLRNRAFNLWREAVLLTFDGKCVVCQDTELPNCHHLIPEKIFTLLRYESINGVVLCPSHHKFNKFSAHKNAVWFMLEIVPKILSKQTLDRLMFLMRKTFDFSGEWTIEMYQEAITKLEARVAELKAAKGKEESSG